MSIKSRLMRKQIRAPETELFLLVRAMSHCPGFFFAILVKDIAQQGAAS